MKSDTTHRGKPEQEEAKKNLAMKEGEVAASGLEPIKSSNI